jgi:hypothetical protein
MSILNKFYTPTIGYPSIVMDGPKIPGQPTSLEEIKTTAKIITYIAKHTPTGSLTESLIDNVFRENVTPVPGSILHCSLYGVEHTGIYLGSHSIIELQGTGEIRRTTPKGFISGTNAITIYVACDGTSPLGSDIISDRAQSMAGKNRRYNILLNNCHQFTSGCISGDFENFNKTFFLLEELIKGKLNSGKEINWRAWDLKTEEKF